MFLSAWYPHKHDPMWGLFVAKQAEAVSLFCDVFVIFIHSDDRVQNKTEFTDTFENGVRIIRILYSKSRLRFLKKTLNALLFQMYLNKAYKYYKLKYGKPHLIHANILTRVVFLAMKIAKKEKIPYVITEHWSRYLPERNEYHGIIRKHFAKKVVRNASALLPVTENLKHAMAEFGIKNPLTQVVPNVVDDAFYIHYNSEFPSVPPIRIVHVSCFDEKAKNIKGILRTIKRITEYRQDFTFDIIGDGLDRLDVEKYYQTLEIPENIVCFKGLLTGNELVENMSNAHFLLMFSNYENAPVVINESFACGIPVIATRVGGIPEIVNTDYGILVDPGNEAELENAIVFMMENYGKFSRTSIMEFALLRFSRASVGKLINDVYNRVLDNSD